MDEDDAEILRVGGCRGHWWLGANVEPRGWIMEGKKGDEEEVA